MKKLDLENYGVQEMNAMEMKETDGGFAWLLVALLVIGIGVLIGALTDGNTTVSASGSMQL